MVERTAVAGPPRRRAGRVGDFGFLMLDFGWEGEAIQGCWARWAGVDFE
jgi:hypothetical protein